jgi:hypothetical protein
LGKETTIMMTTNTLDATISALEAAQARYDQACRALNSYEVTTRTDPTGEFEIPAPTAADIAECERLAAVVNQALIELRAAQKAARRSQR